MADNILRMPVSRGRTLDPETAQAYAELLAQTIGLLDKQIKRLGANRTYHFLRAIEAHVATESV